MRFLLLLSILLCATACTVTDEQTQALDVTPPKFWVAVNNQVAYSTLSQITGPITCNDGSVPAFTGDAGPFPGITVPLDESAGSVYPIEISVLGGDPSGIESIRATVPPGLVWSADTTPTFNNSQSNTYINKGFTPPLLTPRNMEFSYSRVETPDTRFGIWVHDGSANGNFSGLILDIAPESEVCP